MIRHLVLMSLVTLSAQAFDLVNPKPPVAAKKPKDVTVHEDKRIDDYFWLREKGTSEVVDYLEQENAYTEAVGAGSSFADALKAMSVAAEAGKNSTKDLQARIGRSARLGPRSIGVLDAGATSCFLILQSISNSLQRHLAK